MLLPCPVPNARTSLRKWVMKPSTTPSCSRPTIRLPTLVKLSTAYTAAERAQIRCGETCDCPAGTDVASWAPWLPALHLKGPWSVPKPHSLSTPHPSSRKREASAGAQKRKRAPPAMPTWTYVLSRGLPTPPQSSRAEASTLTHGSRHQLPAKG